MKMIIAIKGLLIIGLLACLSACGEDNDQSTPAQLQEASLVIRGGPIYTLNKSNEIAEAVGIEGNMIVFTGSAKDVRNRIGPKTKLIELNGRAMTPGFIESHAHIFSLGHSKMNLDLNDAGNYDELVRKVADAVQRAKPGEWILGRGWHQSKWTPLPEPAVKGFQTHLALSKVSPDNPVFLTHASGHAGFANAKAMEIAGITAETHAIEGGEIIKNESGEPTGIFNENAQALITRHIHNNNQETETKALELGIQEALQNGITSLHNAGTNDQQLRTMEQFAIQNRLGVRIWAMLDGKDEALIKHWFERGAMLGAHHHFLNVRSIKLYADGALGSRGAWLLDDYKDRAEHKGMPANPMTLIGAMAEQSLQHGFQLAVHAIGDRANREVLDQFEAAFKNHPGEASNHRFRIEHAQHINDADIPRFAQLGVIASMQTIHLSSDRPWAIDRLGIERIQSGAYAWQKLLKAGAIVINGSDAPVEPINPIPSFYASITRKTLAGEPKEGYEAELKMTREQSLRSYTLDAAYASFEESIKGSIEIGKLADFTIFSHDLMNMPEEKILDTQVDYTIVDGKIAYERVR